MELHLGQLLIKGTAVSCHGSIVILKSHKICFDCGIIPDKNVNDLMSCRFVCITHSHADHIGALHMDYFLRKRKRGQAVRYLMPTACEFDWKKAFKHFYALDKPGEEVDCPRITAMRAGWLTETFSINDEVKLGKGLIIRAYPTFHRVTSVGYVLTEVRKRLKSEYQSLEGKEIGELVKQGVIVNEVYEKDVFAYTGDTKIEGLLKTPQFLEVEVLMTECTFVGDLVSVELARERGHIHLNEIVENADEFHNDHIILCHFSPRYTKGQIREEVTKKIKGTSLENKIRLFL